MASTPGIGTTATRVTRAQRREEAARIVPEVDVPKRPLPQQEAPLEPSLEPVAQQDPVPAQQPQPAAAQPAVAVPTLGLEPKRGPSKEILNTRVLTATSKRLEWFTTQHGYAVTNVVDVALQEFMNRAGVPDVDSNGNMPA
ncbi:hypothetical protein [Rhodococcoides fascians]|uniref:hypothetical protein n=1 Tax=Rhodococcoides fascians TaxID=1828 RepID=UPI0012D37059|nr:hypothetical protein [Rhodococcus fascians]